MKISKLAFTIVALVASLSASAESENGGRVAANSYKVSFTSPGDGIDTKTYARVMRLVKADLNEVLVFTRTPWGREGEVDLCVKYAPMSERRRATYAKIAKLVQVGNQREGFDKTKIAMSFGCGDEPLPNDTN